MLEDRWRNPELSLRGTCASVIKRLVGTGRFELPTPRTPSECSTRLSHVPTRRKPRAMARNRGNDNFTPELFYTRALSGFLIGRLCSHRLLGWGERNQRHSDESK